MKQADIRHYWYYVKAELEYLHKKDCERGVPDWIPEDIYAACVNQQAFFYLVDDGFVVLRSYIDDDGYLALLVWVAVSDSNDHGALERNAPAIEQKAQEINARRVVFHSTRPGYLRKARDIGYQFCSSKFVKEL